MISALLLIIITLFLPPLGVFLISGCGSDLVINILLCLLGYFPGHIHAFYLEYVYFHRKEARRAGVQPENYQGVYSQRQDPVGVGAGGVGVAAVPGQGYGGGVQRYGSVAPAPPLQQQQQQQGGYAGQESGVVYKN